MTDPTPSAALKALKYAEDQLGVHSVYIEVINKRTNLDTTLNDLSIARDKKRAIESDITDRQFEIMADEHSKHSDMSAAAMDKHLKMAYHADEVLKEKRARLAEMIDSIDGLELDRSMLDTDIKIACARLQELGGYLQYLAAIKNQAQATNNS